VSARTVEQATNNIAIPTIVKHLDILIFSLRSRSLW
jgi:hypothetical protein